jgi:formylglycine-generating enzyme
MGRFDEARLALEAASGGKNTLLLDDLGMPSVMVRIPCFRWSDVVEGGEDAICTAFIVNGVVKNCLYISKFLNIVEYERAYSLPLRDPANTLSIDDAREACARKGRGWHLMSNVEWAAIAHWCRKNGSMPHGNNNFGREVNARHEYGIRTTGDILNTNAEGRVLTGSGPNSWSHDGSPSGIFDLNGNVWDLVAGLRLKEGEIQVIPDNDSALNVDESPASPHWKALDTNGNPVPPGSPNTYKYDGLKEGNSNLKAAMVGEGVQLNTRVDHPHYSGTIKNGDYAYSIMPFQKLTARSGVTAHIRLKQLGLYPVSESLNNENLFVRNYGERIALRGGSWYDGVTSGLWELYLRDSRDFIFPDIGFRAAYVDL